MTEPIVIRCREHGPLVVQGAFRLVDHLGNSYPLPTDKPSVALCRCGQSANKPFCDGSHRTCGFDGGPLAPIPTEAAPEANPGAG
ncbi:MAG: CDGSH iron-sulfur domain-containing protein [Gemmataceae bacterium]